MKKYLKEVLFLLKKNQQLRRWFNLDEFVNEELKQLQL